MPLNDIYSVQVHFELPTSAASYGLYYKETTASSGVDLDTEKLGDAFDLQMAGVILDMLSDDCSQPVITTDKVFGPVDAPRHDNQHSTQVGALVGPSLPNNNALVCAFSQSTFSARSNGRIRIPGIPEPQTNGVTVTNGYKNNELTAFINALIVPVAELSAGAGRWTLGIISAKVRDIALPAKDWAGAFAPVNSIVMLTIIGILKSRKTRAIGRSTVVA